MQTPCQYCGARGSLPINLPAASTWRISAGLPHGVSISTAACDIPIKYEKQQGFLAKGVPRRSPSAPRSCQLIEHIRATKRHSKTRGAHAQTAQSSHESRPVRSTRLAPKVAKEGVYFPRLFSMTTQTWSWIGPGTRLCKPLCDYSIVIGDLRYEPGPWICLHKTARCLSNLAVYHTKASGLKHSFDHSSSPAIPS